MTHEQTTPTPEQVRAEPVGEQLQEWLAELVLGWERITDVDDITRAYRVPGSAWSKVHSDIPPVAYPATVWVVQEAMERRGWRLRLLSPWKVDAPWFAGFYPLESTGWNGKPDHEVSHYNPAVATVKAAILAVLAEREEVAYE